MTTGAETEILDVFEAKLQKLIGMYNGLKSENDELRMALEQSRADESVLKDKMRELEANYENLKASKVLSVSGYDLDSTRKRVSGLVREIDRCIAMLEV